MNERYVREFRDVCEFRDVPELRVPPNLILEVWNPCSISVWPKDERGFLFFFFFFYCNDPNPTIDTQIPDRPNRFLFFIPIAKYLDESFPDPYKPRGINFKP